MHQHEAAEGFNHLTHGFANGIVWSDGRADGNATVFCDLRGHIADAANIDVAMLLGKTEFRGEMLAHKVAVEQCDWPAACFQEFGAQDVGDSRFSRAGKSSKENRQALLVPWWIAAAQFVNHFWVGKPAGDIASFIQTLAQFGTRDAQDARSLRHFVIGHVLILILEIHHHVEGHHVDAQLRLVLFEKFLGFIRAVERLSVGVIPGTCVISSNDQVGTAVVLADDTVPDCFAGPTHAHRQRQHHQLHRSRRILRK